MKTSKTCSKCKSTDILRIPGDIRAFGTGNNILVGGILLLRFVRVTRYVCGNCGFSEEWIDAPEDIAKLREVFGTGPTTRISIKPYWRSLAAWMVIVLALLALFTVLQPGFR